jgi:hypothetical protein
MGNIVVFQVPIDIIEAGIYEWKMSLASSTVTGHVVVRGTKAAPIGKHQWPQGSEAWFQKSEDGGQSSPATFTLELAKIGDPQDPAFVEAVDAIAKNETPIGITPEVPDWQQGAPLGDAPLVFTLDGVSNGVKGHDYDWLYRHISFQMPVGKEPKLPTWYTDDTKIQSVFGGDPEKGVPVQEGIVAKLVEVKPGDAGYPKQGWYWFGRNPEK